MAEPEWSRTIRDQTVLPINLHIPKAYVMAEVEYNANHWTRVFTIDRSPVVVRVRQKKPLTKDITIRMEANFELSEAEQEEIRDRIRYEIGADDHLDTLRNVQDRDVLTKIALKNNAGMRLYASSNTIETAICIMIQQNIEYTEYLEVLRKFVSSYGIPVPWDEDLFVFPAMEVIAEMTEKDWVELGLGMKAKYLGILSKQDLKNFHNFAYYPVYERGISGLKRIEGVGDYTARVIMIYAARRYQKPILDGFIQDMLNHKYKLHQVLPLSQYDKWIHELWGSEEPALVLHAHIQDYLPAYIRDFDFGELSV